MPTDWLRICTEPLDVERLIREVEGGDTGEAGRLGAIVTFLGTVRAENQGRRVVELEYDVYEPLALKALGIIADEIAGRWPGLRVAIHHRVGRLKPGETSVVIVTGSPHRSEGFEACRYAIERVKQIVPIWKREIFAGGEVWIEGATADPDDRNARQLALKRACG
jgi:molybdopterin synthase catalytic subunit